MADLDDTTFASMQDTETDADSPTHVTLMQKMGKNINFLKAQADLLERIDVIAYSALAVRDT